MLTDVSTRLEENEEDVKRFCEKYGVKLLSRGMNNENESTYTFSDGLGYYTIRGIRASLTE